MPCLAVILVNISAHCKSNSVTISKRLRKVLKIKRVAAKNRPFHTREQPPRYAACARTRHPFGVQICPEAPGCPPDVYIFHPLRRTKNRPTDPCRAHSAQKTVYICVKSLKIRTSTPTGCPRWGTRPPCPFWMLPNREAGHPWQHGRAAASVPGTRGH